jgi:L-ascorbate metabolism protein UlaG (beta-lactamase superfamily)
VLSTQYWITARGLEVLRIRWHGHACFEIDGSVRVVTDPHDGKSIGLSPPKVSADIVLISHNHFDHNAYQGVCGPDSKVVSDPVMTVEKGVRIEGITANHDANDGAKRGKITIFRFEVDGTSFCHLGDLGHTLDENLVDRIAPVDVLFVPVGDTFTIGPQAAKSVIDSIAPKVAAPMHYRVPGLGLSLQPVEKFLDAVKGRQVVQVGNEVEFSREDLPENGTDIWVFSR